MVDRVRTNRTYPTLQMDGRRGAAEGNGSDQVGALSGVHTSQNTVAVDLDLRVLHGCSHGVRHSWVWEAGQARFWRKEDQVDPSSRDPKAE